MIVVLYATPIDHPSFFQGIEHINQAQAALQNGDIEGAQRHLDLAKESLGCPPRIHECGPTSGRNDDKIGRAHV